jgi:hypothetical protein
VKLRPSKNKQLQHNTVELLLARLFKLQTVADHTTLLKKLLEQADLQLPLLAELQVEVLHLSLLNPHLRQPIHQFLQLLPMFQTERHTLFHMFQPQLEDGRLSHTLLKSILQDNKSPMSLSQLLATDILPILKKFLLPDHLMELLLPMLMRPPQMEQPSKSLNQQSRINGEPQSPL